MNRWLLSLVIASNLFAAGVVEPEPPSIECRGVIEEFVKDGFQGFSTDGGCEILDITWVIVSSPEEFSGVRHMLLSRSPDGTSPYGKIGDRITFSAYQSTLEGEARVKKWPNQAPEPTTTLVTPPAAARVAPSMVVAHL